MTIRRKMLIIVFLISLIDPVLAQDHRRLTLEECVHIALENNPDYLTAQKEVAKAKASVWEAYSTILPQINAHANLQRAWVIQENTIPNFLKPMLAPLAPIIPEIGQMPDYVQLSFGLEYTFLYGATLTQPLYLGGAGVAGIKMASAAARAAEHNLQFTEQNLYLNVADAFYKCILAREFIAVQEEALKQAEENLNMVSKKYQVGMASRFDKMRAEVEVTNIRPQLVSAKNAYRMALTSLKMGIGIDENTPLEIEGELAFQPDDFGDLSLQDIIKMAHEKRPEMKTLEEQKYISHKGITLAQSYFLPKLFFQTDYSFLAMQNDFKFNQKDFSKGFTSAISLQIPLFSGFKNAKNYQKAKIDYKIMLDTEKKLVDGIEAEVEVSFNKFQEAKETYISAKQSVDLAKEALRLARVMYDEGASTQLDVLNSQLALTRAQLNYISLLYEYQIARYKLRKATGTLSGTIQ
jgi:outer membrane protein